MTDTQDKKDKEKKNKIPYEPPRLFSLGVGTAYAGAPCQQGGTPGNFCKAGGLASGGSGCTEGTMVY